MYVYNYRHKEISSVYIICKRDIIKIRKKQRIENLIYKDPQIFYV